MCNVFKSRCASIICSHSLTNKTSPRTSASVTDKLTDPTRNRWPIIPLTQLNKILIWEASKHSLLQTLFKDNQIK